MTEGFAGASPKVVAFLYLLMRDHIPVGVVHEILEKHLQPGREEFVFSDRDLAAIAVRVATALREAGPTKYGITRASLERQIP